MSSLSPAPASYMSHINGLRALAILGVLLYHLRADMCPAGYFGVDLFLVISGFLLFRSLLKPGVEQNFHYGSYLLRKAWRIIPSWFVVTLVVCVIACLVIHPLRVGDILKTAKYSAHFMADIVIDRNTDYFNVYSQQNPFLHFWYLSITQQLYIVAPLLLIPLTRWVSRRAAVAVLGVLGVLSFAYYVLTTSTVLVPESVRHALLHAFGYKTAYYHLLPRFWEVAAGALVLLLPAWEQRPALRTLLGLLALVGIGVSFYLYDTGSPAIYLTVVLSLLALRYASSGVAAWLLNSKPVQALGTISFSLYLWHWPVMVFWKYYCFDEPGLWDYAGMTVLSLLLGTLSWWGVETLKTPSRKGWVGTLLRSSLVLLCVVAMVGASKTAKGVRRSYEKNFPADMAAGSAIKQPTPKETDEKVLKGIERLAPFQLLAGGPARIGSAEVEPSFFFMGDSHAYHLSYALHESCSKAGIRGLFLNETVFPFWNLQQPPVAEGDKCRWSQDIGEAMLAFLGEHPEMRYVLISMYWDCRLTGHTGIDWRTGKSFEAGDARKAVTGPGLAEFCDRLRALGKEVILLADTPSFRHPSPRDEWERCQQLGRIYRERTVSPDEHEKNNVFSHALFRQLEAEGRAHVLDPAPSLLAQGSYPARRADGEFLYTDTNHLSAHGSAQAVEYLMPRLLELMKAQPPAEVEHEVAADIAR